MTNDVDGNGPTEILSNALGLMRRDAVWVFAVFAILTVPSILADLNLSEEASTRFGALMGTVSLIPQIFLIERALGNAGVLQRTADQRRAFFLRAFGMSFVSGLAIIVGLLALVVPGIFLLVRWAVAMPALIRDDLSITESLAASWDLTKGNAILCLTIIAICCIPIVFAILMLFLGGWNLILETVMLEALSSFSMLLFWFAYTALYLRLSDSK